MSEPRPPNVVDRPAEDAAEPVPIRFWWLKRILAVAGIVLVALLCLRWWWGWDAHRRLQTEIDQYIAAGEPIYPWDFDPPRVSDDQNMGALLMAADAALVLTTEQARLVRDLAYEPANIAYHLEELRRIVKANGAAFDRVRKARGLSLADWGTPSRSPAISTLIPWAHGQRRLSMMLCVTAGYHHLAGADKEAIDTLRDVLAQAQAIDGFPGLWVHTTALTNRNRVARSVERMAPHLLAQFDASGGQSGDGLPGRTQTRSLFTELLNEEAVRTGLVRGMLAERMMLLDLVELCVDGQADVSYLSEHLDIVRPSAWSRALTYINAPALELDGVWMVRRATACVRAAKKPDWPQTASALPGAVTKGSLFYRAAHPLRGLEWVSPDHVVLQHFHSLAITRMAAVALGIRLYELDHGQRPADLNSLVPAYLSRLPADPFSSNEQTLGFKSGGTPPVLYAIGPNGVDDGGRYSFKGDGSIDWRALDIPFFLDGKRPSGKEPGKRETARSTTAGEDDDHEVDGERQTEKR